MSNPDITPERKALALAALALDLHVDCSGFEAHHTVNYRGKLVGLADSALEALARAAEALGLEPDPAVQQQEQTPPGFVTVPIGVIDGQGIIAKENVRARQENAGLRSFIGTLGHEVESFLELYGGKAEEYGTQAFGLLNRLETLIEALPPSTSDPRPTLSESQRETLLIVAEVAADLAVHAGAIEALAEADAEAAAKSVEPTPAVARRGISPADLLAWAAELQGPARLLETLFDLAPKESTPEPDPPIEQFESMLEDWTPDPQEGGKADA